MSSADKTRQQLMASMRKTKAAAATKKAPVKKKAAQPASRRAKTTRSTATPATRKQPVAAASAHSGRASIPSDDYQAGGRVWPD